MTRTVALVVAAFAAGLSAGAFADRTFSPRDDARAADLAAIEKLHKADIEATLTQDLSALTTLWSDNAVKLDVPGPPVVGIKALKQTYEKFRADYPDFKVLKYVPVITDVQIADGWAIEVGNFEAMFRMSAKDQPVSVNDKGVRVLKRQDDGSWKFAVVGLK